jgi:hypothetical protein
LGAESCAGEGAGEDVLVDELIVQFFVGDMTVFRQCTTWVFAGRRVGGGEVNEGFGDRGDWGVVLNL